MCARTVVSMPAATSRCSACPLLAPGPEAPGAFRIERVGPDAIGEWIGRVIDRRNRAVLQIASADLVLVGHHGSPYRRGSGLADFLELTGRQARLRTRLGDRLEKTLQCFLREVTGQVREAVSRHHRGRADAALTMATVVFHGKERGGGLGSPIGNEWVVVLPFEVGVV